MYKIFSSRTDNLVDALGLGWLTRRQTRFREFWALRGIDLTVPHGARVGVIGRNGAGKSTLLKLITGTLAPTEGRIELQGSVQALMDAGAGFHPEFTGYENIHAALTYQGFGKEQLAEAERDIAEFTELGKFLEQPLKTYSLGMQARLAFATATAVRPELLVIDEVLGAGDAYFISKSVERMQQITESGASMLIVSHALSQITQLCQEAIWLERGRIVMQGRSLDVVKAYERYIRELEDARIRDRNEKRSKGTYTSLELDHPTGSLQLRLAVVSEPGTTCEVAQVKLLRDSATIEAIEVGAPQDVNAAHTAFLVLEGSNWSRPIEYGDTYARTLTRESDDAPALGTVVFNLLHLEETARYEVELEYRCDASTLVTVESLRDGVPMSLGQLSGNGGHWVTTRLRVQGGTIEEQSANGGEAAPASARPEQGLSYWPGENSLRIRSVSLTNGAGQECGVFERGERLVLTVTFEAERPDSYHVLPVAVIYRLDGVNVSSQLGEWTTLVLEPGTGYHATVVLDDLNFGNGNYLVSVALYKSFDPELAVPPVVYDWVDRSIEFQVVGTPPAVTSIFKHPSSWSFH